MNASAPSHRRGRAALPFLHSGQDPLPQRPRPWKSRRAAAVVIAAAVHGGLLLALLDARLDVPVAPTQPTVWTRLLAGSRAVPAIRPPTPAHEATRITAPRPLVAPAPQILLPRPTATAVLATPLPASVASAPPAQAPASAPLRLQLAPDELRALEAGSPRTLAQRLAAPPASSVLARRLAPRPEFEEDHANGLDTVRSHGGCYILVPSGQSQFDPFNHGGERLTGRSTNDNC